MGREGRNLKRTGGLDELELDGIGSADVNSNAMVSPGRHGAVLA